MITRKILLTSFLFLVSILAYTQEYQEFVFKDGQKIYQNGDRYKTPTEYSSLPIYPDGGNNGFLDCLLYNIDISNIDVINSAEIVIINCMIDTLGNISSYKLINQSTMKEIQKDDYTPFHKELVKAIGKSKKWIPAHLMGTPINFPIGYRFRIPKGFWEGTLEDFEKRKLKRCGCCK